MGSFVLVAVGSEDYSLTCMIFLERGVAFECLNVIYFCCAVSQTELDSPPLHWGESKNVNDFSKQKTQKALTCTQNKVPFHSPEQQWREIKHSL